MFERRGVLRSAFGLLAGTTLPAGAGAPPEASSGMKHRRYTGTLLYLGDEKTEVGREQFTATIQPTGLRTLRVLCELEPQQFVRDALLTVDGDWNPVGGFVQLTLQQQFEGAAWYHFDEHRAACEGINRTQGRFTQDFILDRPANTFGAHPVHCDGWKLARIRKYKSDLSKMSAGAFTTSTAPMGASGPGLVPLPEDKFTYAYVGPERVTVRAGTFTTEHFRFTVNAIGTIIDVWAHGDDCIPVRMTASGTQQHYELAELRGQYR